MIFGYNKLMNGVKALLVLLLLLSMVQTANAATWVVPDNGDLQSVIYRAQPGDRILIRAGTYHGGFDVNKSLTIMPYDGEVVIDAIGYEFGFKVRDDVSPTTDVSVIRLNFVGGTYGVLIDDIERVDISNCNFNLNEYAVYIDGYCSDITIESSYINGSSSDGIKNNEYKGIDGITIKDTVIANATYRGIYLDDWYDYPLKNVTIENVTVVNAGQEGIYVHMDSEVNSSNVWIRDSTIVNSSKHGIIIKPAKGTISLRNNIIYGCGYGGGDGSYYGIYVDGEGQSLDYFNNTVVECRNGIYVRDFKDFEALKLYFNAGYPANLVDVENVTVKVLADSAVNQFVHAVYMDGYCSDITIESSYINGSSSDGIKNNEYKGVDGITIKDTIIANATYRGIYLDDWYDYPLKNVSIENVTVVNAGQEGIYVHMDSEVNSSNVWIKNSRFEDNNGYGICLNSVKGAVNVTLTKVRSNANGVYVSGSNANLFMKGNEIENSNYGLRANSVGNAYICYNQFSSNYYAIYFEGGTQAEVHYCNIPVVGIDFNEWGIYNAQSNDVNAEYNWWNTEYGIGQHIYDP